MFFSIFILLEREKGSDYCALDTRYQIMKFGHSTHPLKLNTVDSKTLCVPHKRYYLYLLLKKKL